MFLLIFFMLAGTIERLEVIPIDPPVSQNSKMIEEGHITILLGSHDEIVLRDSVVSIKELQKMLTAELKANPAKVITIKADAVSPANSMIDVMDAIRASGGKNISILTQSQALTKKW